MANYSLRNQNNPDFKYTESTSYSRIKNANTYLSTMTKGSTSTGWTMGVNPNYYFSDLFCTGRIFTENRQEVKFLNPKAICGFKQRLWIMNGSKNLSNLVTSSSGVVIVAAQGAGGGGGGGAGWNNFMNPEDAGGQGGHGGAGTITTVYSNNGLSGMHIYAGSGGSGGGHLSNGSDGGRSYLGVYDYGVGSDVYCVCAEGGAGGGHGNQNQSQAYDNYKTRSTTHSSNPFNSSFVYRENYYYTSIKGGNVRQFGYNWNGLSISDLKYMWYCNWGRYSYSDIWRIKQWTGSDGSFSGGGSYGDDNVGRAGGGGASMGGAGGDANKNGPTNGGYGAGGGGGTSRNGGGQTGGKGGDGYVILSW